LIGDKKAKFYAQDSRENALLSEAVSIPSQREAIIRIGRLLADSKMPAPAAIGHRIVHGGPKLRQHCLIDDSVLRCRRAVYGAIGAFADEQVVQVSRHLTEVCVPVSKVEPDKIKLTKT
jgi:hypothetical protein